MDPQENPHVITIILKLNHQKALTHVLEPKGLNRAPSTAHSGFKGLSIVVLL